MRDLVKDNNVLVPLAAIVGAPACDRDPRLATSVNLEAIKLLKEKTLAASKKGPNRIRMLTEAVGESLLSLFSKSLHTFQYTYTNPRLGSINAKMDAGCIRSDDCQVFNGICIKR